MNWYIDVLKKYAVFSGRAHRKEFWMFTLFNFLISFGIAFAEGLAGSPGLLSMIYCLAVFLPALGVSIRRLHDIGKSGWWMLIVLVPLIGVIVYIVFMALDSKGEENAYGPNPKPVTA